MMYSRNLFLDKLQLAILDFLVVVASGVSATWIRHAPVVLGPDATGAGAVPWPTYVFGFTLTGAVFVLLFRYHGLYTVHYGRLVEAFRVLKATSIGTMAVLTLTFFYRGYSYSRATVLIFLPLCVVSVTSARGLYRVYRKAVLAHRHAARRALIVGFGRVGQHLGRALLAQPAYYELVGFLDDDPLKAGGSLEGVRVLGTTADLERIVRDARVDEVLLAVPSASQDRVMDLVGESLRLRVGWKVVPNLCDLMIERLHLDHVGGLPLIGLRGSRIVGFNWAIKRAFDVTVAAAALAVLSPLFVLIALAVKVSSRGPVLYRQTRVGLRGAAFTFLKFRSMRVDSRADLHRSYTADWIYGRTGGGRSVGAAAAAPTAPTESSVHKIVRDPRVTFVGRVLRRTSLDELPQLWNVLRGDMSIVGPRPPIPYEVERYSEWHKRRLEVLPGITGLWQVSGRNALSFDEMVRLDIEYIEAWSLEEDVRILLKTVPALLFGRAY